MVRRFGCDYLVIGAGSAACVLANWLSEDPANRVLLVEASIPGSNPLLHVPAAVSHMLTLASVNWGYWSEPEAGLGGRRVPLSREGARRHQHAQRHDLYPRPRLRLLAVRWLCRWSYDNMLPFFRKAEASERGADAFHGADGMRPLVVTRSRPVPPISEAFLQAAEVEGVPVGVDFNEATQERFGHYDVNIHRDRR